MISNASKKLWNKNFLRIVFSNTLISTAYYMSWAIFIINFFNNNLNLSVNQVVLSIVFTLLGLFAFGPTFSFLIEKKKRKSCCLKAIIILLIVIYSTTLNLPFLLILFLRFIQGAMWAVIQMLLGATLVNDLSDSKNRTLANYHYSWFSRIGFLLGIALPRVLINFEISLNKSYLLFLFIGILGFIEVARLKIPFKAPIKSSIYSLDRFWKAGSFPLFINVMLFASLFGLYLANSYTLESYIFVLLGFLVTIICERTLFDNTDKKAEIVMGAIFIFASIFLFFRYDENFYLCHLLFGAGISLVLSRFLIYFIKLSGHSQRGTLTNTYFLSVELGIIFGTIMVLYLGLSIYLPLIITTLALVIYLLLSHNWFMKHKNRDFKFKEI